MRPAKGCSFDASGNDALPRKEDASVAEEGSKGWGAKVVVGAVSAERLSPDEEGCFADLLPVKASQMDMVRKVEYDDTVVEKNPAGERLRE